VVESNADDAPALIARICDTKGWTKIRLARELGASPTSVYRWGSPNSTIRPPKGRLLELHALATRGFDRQLYGIVAAIIRVAGVSSLADLRNRLEKREQRPSNAALHAVVLALAEDGLIDFAWRL
jgi:hypothetical protein